MFPHLAMKWVQIRGTLWAEHQDAEKTAEATTLTQQLEASYNETVQKEEELKSLKVEQAFIEQIDPKAAARQRERDEAENEADSTRFRKSPAPDRERNNDDDMEGGWETRSENGEDKTKERSYLGNPTTPNKRISTSTIG